ncbi:PIN domain-containing protein [Pyrobaculum sp.]|uniref:PIN domain-containing protein n=1 Tax=Pyrobaculum sp. TaxID=2004705 RepID=UPI00317FB3E7
MALINVYREAGISINLVEIEEKDLDKALEFLNKLKWDEREIRMKFDILLFAQAVTRGVKLFTKDNDFLDIRDSLFGPPADMRDRKTGLKIYEDEYLFISYAA